MTDEERVACYERIMDRALAVAAQAEEALAAYDAIGPSLKALEAYYTGGLWREDYEADEAGRFPAGLKRGVLSQDGVYDLLQRYSELEKRIRDKAPAPGAGEGAEP